MLNDTPKDNTYTQYNLVHNHTKHSFRYTLENGIGLIYHTLSCRLTIQDYSVKVEKTPTFFGDYYVFLSENGVYLGVANA